ncbi:hypothetical protein EIP86_006502 [Pleurotus ostreatoroseus]|nr:hypothetical protein EIP86_006502 [Pleurotus ostreatoroseus]
MQRHWLEAVWTLPALGQRHGPSVLLMPIALYTSVTDCENGDKTLLSIDAYEDALHRRLRSVCDASIITQGRLSDLASFAAQCLLSIISCFRGTYDSVIVQEMSSLALRLGEEDVLLRLLGLLEETKHAGLKAIIQLHLKPTIIRLGNASNAEHNSQRLVGELWIAFSQMLIGFFVPNTPIDPALLQRRALQFHQKETTALQAQMDMHRDFELRTTGNSSNGTIQFLESLLADIPVPISRSNVQTLERGDLHRLQTYWAEVLEFLNRVVPASRIRSLLSAATSERSNIAQLEHVIQESITAFCQRLNGIYQDFNDISAPIHTALLGMKLGLRLFVDAAAREATSSHVQTVGVLLAFPSVSSAERLRATDVLNTQDASFDLLVIKLAGFIVEATLLGTVQPFISYINQLYEQAVGLWLIDGARAEEKEREAQSLYRRKGVADELDEAAAEEEEFLSIFPEFEDVLGGEDGPSEDHKPAQHKPIIQGLASSQLFDMHQALFLQNVTPKDSLSRYSRCRRTFLVNLVEPEAHDWPEELDAQSSAFQISLLHDRLETLHVDTVPSRSHDFYHDRNVPEAKKAAHVLQALSRRLDALIIEWPDQMVLQHLKSRCDVIEKFTFDSPIAKILSALEQLLLQLEDWEMYANRDNSLKNHRQAMIELIVRWRRMELSAWQGLLDRQAAIFVDATAEWWFRLYNAAVRGVVSATRTDTEKHGGATSVDKFLDDLVPLLDDFMSHGPLGQFIARLDLLRSMERFVDLLLKADIQQAAESLGRVLRVLHFTRCYYEQFKSKVSDSLSAQRAVLEKEIQDFIKLASWKDVNVQALRQSAQKTHRQLYKIIRKFKDILRQPVNALLQPSTSSAALKRSIQDNHANPEAFLRFSDVPSFPSLPSLDSPEHLVNLTTTFRNYTALINGRLFGSMESHLPLSVESFAEDIISTSKALADSVIPANLEADRRLALQKNVLTRKRKAWSDLLKELKRAGLSANVKPEVLELTRSQRRICEQIQIDTDVMDSTLVHKAEDYFYRLSSMLPRLRGTLSDHNADLSTRELQRAVMHIESCFALALRSRTCLGRAAIDLGTFTTLHRRLADIGADPHIAGAGPTVLPYIVFAQNMASGLNSALQEISELLVNLHTDNPAFIVSAVIFEELPKAIGTLEELTKSLSDIYRRSKASMCPVLLNGEYDTVKSAFAQVSHVSNTLEQWCAEYPHLTTFMQPALVWLRQKQVPNLDRPASPGSPAFDRAVDSTLLTVQVMLKACESTENVTGEEERDNYIKDDCRFVCTLSERLNLERLVLDLEGVIEESSCMTSEDISVSIARTSPFLDRYLSLAQAQIATQSSWTKSLFKLAYVLCTVVGSVAKDGFCRPQDGEAAEDDGEGQEAGEGAGMGEGTGSENVSKDIQEESQVEGLQGEDAEGTEKVERAEEGNAIEMSEDFGGELQDVPPDEGEQEEQSGDESEGEPDEQLADLGGDDEDAIDEKLWGDEQGPEDKDNGGKTDKDHSKKDSGPSETVAKEDEEGKNEKERQQEQPEEQPQEQPVEEGSDAPAEDEEAPGPDGAPLDEFTQEAETLDLPENIELDGPEKQDAEGGMDDEDDLMDDEPEEVADSAPEPGSQDGPPEEDEAMDVDGGMQQATEEDVPEGQAPEEDSNEDAVAQPDTHAGDGVAQDPSAGDTASSEATKDQSTEGQKPEQSAGDIGTTPGETSKVEDQITSQQTEREEAAELPQAEPASAQSTSDGGSGTQRGTSNAIPQESRPLSNNPLRSLGDALREISQRFNEILESESEGKTDRQEAKSEANKDEPTQLEYIHEDDTQDEMQALGPAGEEREAKLRELNLVDDEEPVTDRVALTEEDAMDVDSAPPDVKKSSLDVQQTSESLQNGEESALTPAEIRGSRPGGSQDGLASVIPETQSTADMDDAEEAAELVLKQWQAEGQPSEQAEQIWRRYESLTHDLSYTLCEQLRLILEPTMATRLKGDYRTGKRLNMKKIIPYIASEYTKDKIWLRRTRPSQREYQVLIALDDSKSMAESHSVHLAFQTLALVSKALSRLEVGDVAIAKFGQSVDVLHGFEAPFTDQAGTKIMDAFKFNQQATQVQSLLEASLTLLEQARERRAMSSSSAADLWQMEIIISDGICQDHERLRTVLRKAEEQRVMVVFIILDSLHTSNSTSTSAKAVSQNSILSMNQVAYKEVDGRMDLTVTRYLDTFPFQYYVVVRNVEALPDVLAGTLKQFFERISEE